MIRVRVELRSHADCFVLYAIELQIRPTGLKSRHDTDLARSD